MQNNGSHAGNSENYFGNLPPALMCSVSGHLLAHPLHFALCQPGRPGAPPITDHGTLLAHPVAANIVNPIGWQTSIDTLPVWHRDSNRYHQSISSIPPPCRRRVNHHLCPMVACSHARLSTPWLGCFHSWTTCLIAKHALHCPQESKSPRRFCIQEPCRAFLPNPPPLKRGLYFAPTIYQFSILLSPRSTFDAPYPK